MGNEYGNNPGRESKYIDPEVPTDEEKLPPGFKLRNPDPEAIEGNWEWETSELMGSGEVLQVACDYLGPEISADIIARHWMHSGRVDDIIVMARHLQELAKRAPVY